MYNFDQPDNKTICCHFFLVHVSFVVFFVCVPFAFRTDITFTQRFDLPSEEKIDGVGCCTALAAPPPYICSGDGHLPKPTQRTLDFQNPILQAILRRDFSTKLHFRPKKELAPLTQQTP